jgi:hypothetical protein
VYFYSRWFQELLGYRVIEVRAGTKELKWMLVERTPLRLHLAAALMLLSPVKSQKGNLIYHAKVTAEYDINKLQLY